MWTHTRSCLWERLFTASTAARVSAGVVHPPALCFVIARRLDVIRASKYALDGGGKAEFVTELQPELFSVEL